MNVRPSPSAAFPPATEALSSHPAELDLTEQIDKACIAVLFGNCRPAIATNAALGALGALVAFTAWPDAPRYLVSGWLAVLLAFNLARYAMTRAFPPADDSHAAFTAWARRYAAATGLGGLIWGGAGYAFLITDNQTVQFFLLVATLGICTGAVSASAPWRPVLLAFLAGTLTPMIVALVATGSTIHQVIGVMAAIYFAMLWVTGRNINESLRGSFDGRFRNEALAEALLRAKEEAESANRAKSLFLSSMSHELRTPLNAILGFTEFLSMAPASETQDQAITNIRDAGGHLRDLINQILDLAEIEAGAVDMEWQEVALAPIVRESAAILAPSAENNDVTVGDLSAFGAPAVWADPLRVKQVVINLMSNAVKYNRPGGEIRVGWRETEAGTVRLSIADTGSGISAEKQALLFAPFTRLGVEATNIEGSGIGLTISKHLVELMGGEIGYETTPGEGSTFWFELPKAA